jgi:hypothetical protein
VHQERRLKGQAEKLERTYLQFGIPVGKKSFAINCEIILRPFGCHFARIGY